MRIANRLKQWIAEWRGDDYDFEIELSKNPALHSVPVVPTGEAEVALTPTEPELSVKQAFVIAVLNEKGGVGKTTTSVSIAAALSIRSDVLLIDLDRQGSATIALGHKPIAERAKTMAASLVQGQAVDRLIMPSGCERLDLIPSGSGMTFVENQMNPRFDLLDKLLQPIRDRYDFVVMDCPPNFTLLSANALHASDAYIATVGVDHLALQGLESLLSTVSRLMPKDSGPTPLLGILVTKVNQRSSIEREKFLHVRERYQDLLFNTFIPHDPRLADAPAEGKTIFDYAAGSVGARRYWDLAKEVVARAEALKTQGYATVTPTLEVPEMQELPETAPEVTSSVPRPQPYTPAKRVRDPRN